jgi:hypothetical protein
MQDGPFSRVIWQRVSRGSVGQHARQAPAFFVGLAVFGVLFPAARPTFPDQGDPIMGLILLIVLVLLLVGAFPSWGHSQNWGYGPSGLLGFVLVVVLIMVLLGYIPRSF